MADESTETTWYVYLLRCSDSSLYCGITTDPERRLKEHRGGNGSSYVRGRLPADMVYQEKIEGGRSRALRREAEIKSLSRSRKESLVKSGNARGP